MSSRADELRKRIAKRKKDREKADTDLQRRFFLAEDEERYGYDKFPSLNGNSGEGNHPLFRKEVFIFKILISACLVLIIAILFREPNTKLDPAKNLVKSALEKDFQFASVSSWYEDQFGKPLALLPGKKTVEEEDLNGQQYALPASGSRILKDFDANGQSITIETGKDAEVEAMNEGLVIKVGVEEGFGKTVVIQHADKSESWYGNLDEINVNLYEFIKKGTKVGKSSENEDQTKGSFLFAIKKGDNFIDPIQVIRFE
ncbi:M23 family metallopeptidase [Mesobacillus harenae]|uniref:M23 family metallopeptidase n=1 Tax=Mesobacillus harenae TaxID=2213203 RepID=UPI00157FC645|nr:M23 family metallopeptidase [Mesobacillus harenae]